MDAVLSLVLSASSHVHELSSLIAVWVAPFVLSGPMVRAGFATHPNSLTVTPDACRCGLVLDARCTAGHFTSHWFHVVFALLLIELAFFFCTCVLVLLVLGYEIIHVGFRLREFHFVHALTGIPMKKCFASEHT